MSENLLEKQKLKIFIKSKVEGIHKLAGRNNSGKITIRHKGGGHKRRYRKIDFKRVENSSGIVCSIEYDPNRNADIAAVYDSDLNNFFYIIAPQNLKIGDIVESGKEVEPKLGNTLTISRIPKGSYIHNIALSKQKHATMSRSAGAFSKLKEIGPKFGLIQMNSGALKFVPVTCRATIGIVSNELFFFQKKYKAGQSRWVGKRPSVRGVAMNPVDHPHGGGEGKKSGLNKTPWGKYNLRGKTSRSKTFISRIKNSASAAK